MGSEARLRGDPPDWERERAYVLDLDDFWKKGPTAANAEIARRLAEIDARRLRELFARAGYGEDLDAILVRLARDDRPAADTTGARDALDAFRAAVAGLRPMLAKAETATPGIGHNRPPEDARFTQHELEAAESARETLDAELAKPEPEPEAVARQTRRLVLVYDGLARRAGIFETNLWAGAGAAVGGAAVFGFGSLAAAHGPTVLEGLGHVIDAAMTWLGAGPPAAGSGVVPPPPSAPPSISI